MGVPTTSAELTSAIAALTSKALDGSINDTELALGLSLLRQDRMSIKAAPKKGAGRTKKAKVGEPTVETTSAEATGSEAS